MSDYLYRYQSGGSTATSAATGHLLFGAYQGLSLLANGHRVRIQVSASTGIAVLNGGAANAGTDGMVLAPSNLYELPVVRAGDASQIQIARRDTNNPVVYWSIWKEIQYTFD